MPATIANTYSNAVDNTSGTANCAITRAAGEGLLFGYWYDYDFGAPSVISSAVWDPTGDNQALSLVALRQLELAGALENRYFALYELKNPTSAKSGNVVIVHAGTTLSRGAFLCRNIIDFDPVAWITAFNSRTEANPLTNDLPNTVNSASGELGVFFGAMRNEVAYIAAGDLGGYSEQVVLAGSRSLFSGSKASVGSTVSGTFGYDDPGTNYDNALIAVSIAPGSGTAPTISTQPTAQTVTAPAAATFTAAVTGTYTGLRWQRQAAGAGAWADISGATSTTLTTGATTVSGGSWNSTDRVRLQVDWSGGTVTSTDVALTVNAAGAAPAITVQPTNQSATVGGTATFSVTATGSGTLAYQWERSINGGSSWANVTTGSGGTTSTYVTAATSISGGNANNGDQYRCVVAGDTAPPATSSAATLTVQQPIATTFAFTISGGANLTGIKYAIHEETTPDQWVAPIKKGADETSDADGLCVVSVVGLTTRRVGELGSAFATNSDGTATGGAQAATRRNAYYVGAFS